MKKLHLNKITIYIYMCVFVCNLILFPRTYFLIIYRNLDKSSCLGTHGFNDR